MDRLRTLLRFIIVGSTAVCFGCGESPLKPSAPGFIMTFVDALTKTPVVGLAVDVARDSVTTMVTDARGRIKLSSALPGTVAVDVHTGSASRPYHRFAQEVIVSERGAVDVVMIPFVRLTSPTFAQTNLLTVVKSLTSSDRPSFQHLVSWGARPVKTYIPPFVNSEGIDYGAISRQAAEHWMKRTGLDLFNFVDEPPDTGVVVMYRSPAEMGINIAVTHYDLGDDYQHLVQAAIHVRTNFPAGSEHKLYQVMMHEFGHTLRLGHLMTREFIMYAGQPLPDDIHDDEVTITRLYTALPVGLDMGAYDSTDPVR